MESNGCEACTSCTTVLLFYWLWAYHRKNIFLYSLDSESTDSCKKQIAYQLVKRRIMSKGGLLLQCEPVILAVFMTGYNQVTATIICEHVTYHSETPGSCNTLSNTYTTSIQYKV